MGGDEATQSSATAESSSHPDGWTDDGEEVVALELEVETFLRKLGLQWELEQGSVEGGLLLLEPRKR